ncbi:MAG: hypothetical protein L0Y70_25825, partial [Gemmataceae bacterium]|nr:hypothetical protein [Gemmataceae bacterium]
QLGIKDYFVFDPEAKYLNPPLLGFRLVRGKSVPIKPNPDGTIPCKELGLLLKTEGTLLRFIDMETGKPIPTRSERLAFEEARAEQLAAEVEKLKAQLGRAAKGTALRNER